MTVMFTWAGMAFLRLHGGAASVLLALLVAFGSFCATAYRVEGADEQFLSDHDRSRAEVHSQAMDGSHLQYDNLFVDDIEADRRYSGYNQDGKMHAARKIRTAEQLSMELRIYRGIKNPLRKLTIFTNDIVKKFCSRKQLARTVVADIRSLNLSGVELVLVAAVQKTSRTSGRGLTLSAKIFPRLSNSPLPQVTSWVDLPDVTCTSCPHLNGAFFPVILPSRHEVLYFQQVNTTNNSSACGRAHQNSSFCMLPTFVWHAGDIAPINASVSSMVLEEGLDIRSIALTSLSGADGSSTFVYMYTSTVNKTTPAQDSCGLSCLWRLEFSSHSPLGEWVLVDKSSPDKPSRRLRGGAQANFWSIDDVYLFSSSNSSRLVLFGGQSPESGQPMLDLWLFDMASGHWRNLTPLPWRQSSAYASVFSASVYIYNGVSTLLVSERVYDLNYIHTIDLDKPDAQWSRFLPQQSTPYLDGSWLVSGMDSVYLVGDSPDITYPASYRVIIPVSSLSRETSAPAVYFPDLADRDAVSGPLTLPDYVRPVVVEVHHADEGPGDESCEAIILGGTWLEKPPESVMSMVWKMELGVKQHMENNYARLTSFSLPNYPWNIGHYGMRTVLFDKIAVMYGGSNSTASSPALWCFDTKYSRWLEASAADPTNVPLSRALHGMFRLDAFTFVVVGGAHGTGSKREILRDVWAFRFSNLAGCQGEWFEMLPVSPPAIPAMEDHSVTVVDSHVLVFGGAVKNVQPLIQISVNFSCGQYSWKYIVLPFIEIVDYPCQGHVLVPYNENSLLLYGGKNNSGGLVQSAILLQYMTTLQGDFLVMDVIPFFQHPGTSNLASACNFVFSLYEQQEVNSQHGQVSRLRVTYIPHTSCVAGYEFNSSSSICVACAVGKWSPGGQVACSTCPIGTTTEIEASISVANCTPCAFRNYCHGHGSCTIRGNVAVCACHFGYLRTDQCKIPYIAIAILSISFLIAVVTVLVLRRYRQQKAAAKNLQYRLKMSSRRIRDLSTAWLVEESQLDMKTILGAGGFGEVWLAEFNDMLVVVKKLHTHCLIDDVAVQEFQREAELMKTLRHQNLVLFLGAGTNCRHEPFLVLEYVKRGSLNTILADHTIPISHADKLRFMLDAAKGMEYLHSTSPPIMHRDLKSANLLVTERWVVKVADFGTAKLLSHLDEYQHVQQARRPSMSSELTRLLPAKDFHVTSKIGTLPYQSPEMLCENTYTISTDVYR